MRDLVRGLSIYTEHHSAICTRSLNGDWKSLRSFRVVILRHEAFPLALNHAMWEKYKIGESEKINDPETKAPAVKNPYFQAKPGALRNDNTAIDKLLARGTVFGACSVALRGHARRLAKNANVTPEEAAKEFTANIIPGITLIPSGVWGVNRAQEAGCTYLAGG
jgi:hypothetical protein